MSKKRILTGDRPTGPLHIGHFVGSLISRVELQNEYEMFILVADLHTLTTKSNPVSMRENIINVVADNIAAGVDPKKATFIIQSEIPEIAELSVILGMYTTVNRLQRVPTLKEIMSDLHINQPSFGLLGYPVLQAADILSFQANLVPVGEDQLSHIEVTRELAKKINTLAGKSILTLPKPHLQKVARLLGTDGQAKMSKSIGNTIALGDTKETVKKKVMSMYTDPNRLKATDKGRVEGNPVFQYHDAFNHNLAEVEDLKQRYTKGKVGDVEVKEKLVVALEKLLAPIRERRAGLTNTQIENILKEGTAKARVEVQKTLDQVKKGIGLGL